MKYIDITGIKFGRLTAISRDYGYKWICVCDCGKTLSVDKNNLRSGHTKSCGCLEKDHPFGVCGDGLRKHPLYQTWKTMIYRCTKPKRKEYKNYGGRGIMVCSRWMVFSNFIDDMYHSYIEGYELDRHPNNDGDYEPLNCRWVSGLINKRKTRRTKLDEDKMGYILSSNKIAKELAIMFGCSIDAIYDVRQKKTWI